MVVELLHVEGETDIPVIADFLNFAKATEMCQEIQHETSFCSRPKVYDPLARKR